MSVLRKQAKKPKRTARLRCPGHLAFVRKFCCLVGSVGCQGPVEAAHWRLGAHAGMGQKPDDDRAIPLCQHHHRQAHSVGEETFAKGFGINPEKAIAELCKQSPALKRLKAKERA